MSQPIKPLEEIAEQWFVNRQEHLDYFWKWGNNIPAPGNSSVAFAGLRRTGKTAILHRVFNRLFNEQDVVIPVFITFEQYLYRPKMITIREFAVHYFTSYVRSYLAFTYRRPDLHQTQANLSELQKLAEEMQDKVVLPLIANYDLQVADKSNPFGATDLAAWLINMPKGQAAIREMPTAVFIDEFQILADVHDPDNDRVVPLTNYYQKPSESMVAPMVVSGSSVSILFGRATGGALSGRLRYRFLDPLDPSFAMLLVTRLCQHRNIPVDYVFAYAILQLTQGYPYAIESLVNSESPAAEHYPNINALDEVVRFELIHPRGQLFKHYNEEFHKYSKLLNDGQTTKKVMFWATQYPEQRIPVKEVAAKIGVKPQEVQESLQKLEELDIVHRVSLSVFEGPTEPMLRRFITYQYDFEIQELAKEQAAKNIELEVRSELRRMTNIMGHFAEIVVGAVMKGFDGRILDGPSYFSTSAPVPVPNIHKIENRWGVIEGGDQKELDLIGEYQGYDEEAEVFTRNAWFVQVKYRNNKVTSTDVQRFFEQIHAIKDVRGYDEVTPWYVSKAGYFEPAKKLLEEEGIYYTDLQQFNDLADAFGYLGFPAKSR
ncbi:MAG: AsnC family protein [Chloroflexota bacterium]